MNTKKKPGPESIVREIKRRTRRKYSAEEKIRIVLEGLRGEQSITDLSRREGIHPGIYYKWSIPLAAWLAPARSPGAWTSSVAISDFFLYAPLDNDAAQTFEVRGSAPQIDTS